MEIIGKSAHKKSYLPKLLQVSGFWDFKAQFARNSKFWKTCFTKFLNYFLHLYTSGPISLYKKNIIAVPCCALLIPLFWDRTYICLLQNLRTRRCCDARPRGARPKNRARQSARPRPNSCWTATIPPSTIPPWTWRTATSTTSGRRWRQGWKKPGFLIKNQPRFFGFFGGFFGFFWFFWGGFLGFLGFRFFLFFCFVCFFGFFKKYICPEERVFRVFSVSWMLLGASRL